MTEQELRALVRDAIARHLTVAPGGLQPPPGAAVMPASFLRQHASHAMFTLADGAGTERSHDAGNDTPCVIEPAVRCDGCGYCKSLGH